MKKQNDGAIIEIVSYIILLPNNPDICQIIWSEFNLIITIFILQFNPGYVTLLIPIHVH